MVVSFPYLMHKAESVCVSAIHTCISCAVGVKLAVILGHRGSGYSGVDVARLAVHSELSFHFCFFLCG